MLLKDWNIEAMTGYAPKTTFYTDFSIADGFGESAVRDTFKRAFDNWKDNITYLTELVMVLNWKIFEHYEKNEELARLYDELWKQADSWCMDNLDGDNLSYYLRTTD